MQLIKLVYLCHGWMLGICGRPLTADGVEAWRYGPVPPEVYFKYKAFRGDPIDYSESSDSENLFNDEQRALIEEVLSVYGKFEGWELSSLTHTPGSPWDQVYKNGKGLGAIIPNKLIRNYYQEACSD